MELYPEKKLSHFALMALAVGIISVMALIFVLFATQANTDLWDVGVYYRYANMTFTEGKIPYVDYTIEYPQVSLVSIMLPYIPVLLTGSPDMFIPAHMLLMMMFHVLTIMFTYLITEKLYGRRRAFYVAGILTLLAPLTYYAITKFDAFPACIMMFSIYLFVRRRQTGSYLMATLGAMTKIFPFILFPFYIINNIKNKISYWFELVITVYIVAALVMLPISLNVKNFLFTYTMHANRGIQSESIYFLIYAITGINFGTGTLNIIATLLPFACVATVAFGYYRNSSPSDDAMLSYLTLALFLFIVLNKVFSPQYILWIAPLFAIQFTGKIRDTLLFIVITALMFVEYPMLIYTIFSPYEYLILHLATIFFIIKFALWFSALGILLNISDMFNTKSVEFIP
jgi:hypothetical protein